MQGHLPELTTTWLRCLVVSALLWTLWASRDSQARGGEAVQVTFCKKQA